MKEAERLRNFFPVIWWRNTANSRTDRELFRKRNQTSRRHLLRGAQSRPLAQLAWPCSATRNAVPAGRARDVETSSHETL